jgi:hypothetical protein
VHLAMPKSTATTVHNNQITLTRKDWFTGFELEYKTQMYIYKPTPASGSKKEMLMGNTRIIIKTLNFLRRNFQNPTTTYSLTNQTSGSK